MKIKLYICFSGFFDENIDLITTDLDKAFNYANNTRELIDIREYEATIHKNQFVRPKRPNKKEKSNEKKN